MDIGEFHNVAAARGSASVGRSPSSPADDDVGQLIANARSGSVEALGRLLEGCRKYLLFCAEKSLDSDLRPKGGASDLVQDTFAAAHHDFAGFRGDTEQELIAWLTQILNNRLTNHIRRYRYTLKRAVRREFPLEFIALNRAAKRQLSVGGPNPVKLEEERRLQDTLSRLPAAMQQVLILRTWERRSFAEIAATMQGTPDSVRKLWTRAIQRLRTEFSKT